MRFMDRLKLSIEFRSWLIEENEKNNFKIVSNPETFLVFLEIKGYKLIKKEEIDNLPRIKVGNSNSPTVKYCIDELLINELFERD